MQSANEQRHAFSIWLRTGQLPRYAHGSRRELKFNPWHDPRNGRFTFREAGRYYAPDDKGDAASSNGRGQSVPSIVFPQDSSRPSFTTPEEVNAWAAALSAKHGHKRGFREAIEARRQFYLEDLARAKPTPPPGDALSKIGQLVSGFGNGVYDVGEGLAKGLYSLATTNPITSVQNIEFGIAQSIDGAIGAEDTPAHAQISRAAHAIVNASAYDFGHALGTFSGNAALAIAPGAIVSKVSIAARAGAAGKVAGAAIRPAARFGEAVTSDYRSTFFDANPTLKNQVVVHHAVEKQVVDRFPGTVTESEMHSLENLRGVPNELNSDLHLSKIRTEWNQFYKAFEAAGTAPTKEQLLQKATEIDTKYGSHFNPPR